MASIIENIILMLLLSAVIIIIVGIGFYEYVPNGVEISKPNEYEVNEDITKVLGAIDEDSKKFDTKEPSGAIVHAYTLDAGDLKVFEQSKSYISGKADPFDDIAKEPTPGTGNNVSNSTGNSVGGTTSNSSSSNKNTNKNNVQVSDGTLFNSTTSK